MAVKGIRFNGKLARAFNNYPYLEAVAETRSEIAAFSTKYADGSSIICAEDWSVWLLCTRNGLRAWQEVGATEDPEDNGGEVGE